MARYQTSNNSGLRIRKMTSAALMVALSAVGAFIKIPGPLGTIALDSCPGYLYASLYGSFGGAVVAFFGHLASAVTVGFPLGIPIHLVVAAEMGLCAAVYGWIGRGVLSKSSWTFACLVAVLLNGVGAPLVLSPWLGITAAIPLVLPLIIASSINVAAAILAFRILNPRVNPGGTHHL